MTLSRGGIQLLCDKTVMNYKANKKVDGHNLDKLAPVVFDKESNTATQRRGRFDKKSLEKDDGVIDNQYGMEVDKTKQTGPMGSKYMNKYMDVSGYKNDINDR